MADEKGPASQQTPALPIASSKLVVGVAVLGSVVVGVLSLLLALLYFNNQSTGAGTCLIAAALAWGQLANALLRK